LLCRELALLDELRERPVDALEPLVDEVLRDLTDDHLAARRCCDLRDAGAHQAAAEDTYFPDFHAFHFSLSWRCGARAPSFTNESLPIRAVTPPARRRPCRRSVSL